MNIDNDLKDVLKYFFGTLIGGATFMGIIYQFVKDSNLMIIYMLLIIIFIWLFYIQVKLNKIKRKKDKEEKDDEK